MRKLTVITALVLVAALLLPGCHGSVGKERFQVP